MIWKSEGGGPWGAGPRGGGGSPWGGGRGGGPGPRAARAARRRPTSRKFCGAARTGSGASCRAGSAARRRDRARRCHRDSRAVAGERLLPGSARRVRAIVLRFGAYNRTTQPGLNYHLPAPIEMRADAERHAHQPDSRSAIARARARGAGGRQVAEEALMLTGDENIVDINFTVFWLIKDAQSYLFNIRGPEATVKSAAESAMREVVGETPIAAGAGRGPRQDRDRDPGAAAAHPQLLRRRHPDHAGADGRRSIRRPRSSTRSATCSARWPTASGCATRPRPIATTSCRGRAATRLRIKQEADAYRQEIVARAQGDADRFLSVYNAFKQCRRTSRCSASISRRWKRS